MKECFNINFSIGECSQIVDIQILRIVLLCIKQIGMQLLFYDDYTICEPRDEINAHEIGNTF